MKNSLYLIVLFAGFAGIACGDSNAANTISDGGDAALPTSAEEVLVATCSGGSLTMDTPLGPIADVEVEGWTGGDRAGAPFAVRLTRRVFSGPFASVATTTGLIAPQKSIVRSRFTNVS